MLRYITDVTCVSWQTENDHILKSFHIRLIQHNMHFIKPPNFYRTAKAGIPVMFWYSEPTDEIFNFISTFKYINIVQVSPPLGRAPVRYPRAR